MTTVREIIEAAGGKIGVKDMTAEDLVDGMFALNMMLNEWSVSRQKISAVTRENFNITSGTASYTVGSGGDIDTTWPSRIIAAYIKQDGIDYPLAVFSAETYAYTGQKAESEKSVALYHERTFPLGTFFFWPSPDATYAVHLWSNKSFPTYSSYTTTIALPPEYEPAMIYNLAVELAPDYERDPSQTVIARAVTSLRAVKTMNAHPVPQINTNVVCNGGSSGGLFDAYMSNRVGYTTLPFVLR